MQKQFGNYTLVERLGVGGMGEVHRAIKGGPGGFEVEVALKLILPHLAREDAFRKRFTREAKLAASLNHPNIVRVHGHDLLDGSPFIEMEYVKGVDLAALMRSLDEGRRLSLPEAAYIIHGVARGLEYAHTRPEGQPGDDKDPGPVIHRDLNPHNILLSTAGEVKIADFGIARASLADATVTATLMGKLSYMAPEQVDGKKLDHRCDLFSLGITAYQLLTGTHPFKRGSEAATLVALQKASFRPLAEAGPGIPAEVITVIESLLSADPEDRPERAGQVADIMENQVLPGTSSALAGKVETASSFKPGSSDPSSTVVSLSSVSRGSGSTGPTPTEPTIVRSGASRIHPFIPYILAAGGAALLIVLASFTNHQPVKSVKEPGTSPVLPGPRADDHLPSRSALEENSVKQVKIASVPPRAEIYREGVFIGSAPLSVTLSKVEKGMELQARSPGHTPTPFTVYRNNAGDEYTVHLEPTVMGTVKISIRPYGTISLDGKVIGESHRVFELPVGQHLLVLANDKLGLEKVVNINVEEGENLFQFELEE